MSMTFDEIIDLMGRGEEFNVLEWSPQDRTRYLMLVLSSIGSVAEHILTEHFRSEEEGFEGDVQNEDEYEVVFEEWDKAIVSCHAVHHLLQSFLSEEYRKRRMIQRLETTLGVPIKNAEMVTPGVYGVVADHDWLDRELGGDSEQSGGEATEG